MRSTYGSVQRLPFQTTPSHFSFPRKFQCSRNLYRYMSTTSSPPPTVSLFFFRKWRKRYSLGYQQSEEQVVKFCLDLASLNLIWFLLLTGQASFSLFLGRLVARIAFSWGTYFTCLVFCVLPELINLGLYLTCLEVCTYLSRECFSVRELLAVNAVSDRNSVSDCRCFVCFFFPFFSAWLEIQVHFWSKFFF